MAGPITIATAVSRIKGKRRAPPPIIDIDIDDEDTVPVPRHGRTFWERHALSIITVTLGVLFFAVIAVQMVT